MNYRHFYFLGLALLSLLFAGCGKGNHDRTNIESRIINGAPVASPSGTLLDAVLRISLTYPDGSNGFCSGVLVSPHSAITSGHCIAEGSPIVTSVISSVGAATSIVRSSVHPDYRVDSDAGAIFGDIALLQLSSPLEVTPAPLLQSVLIAASEVVTVAGYGIDESGEFGALQSGTMTISLATDNHLLAFFAGDNSNTCNGDSGGPAIGKAITIDGAGLEGVIGLTSSGLRDDCKAGDTTYFTNLQNASIASWLIEQDPEIVLN